MHHLISYFINENTSMIFFLRLKKIKINTFKKVQQFNVTYYINVTNVEKNNKVLTHKRKGNLFLLFLA